MAVICLAPFCLGVLFIGGGGALIIWLVTRQWKPKTAIEVARERSEMQQQVDQKVAELRPWSFSSLSDLSTDWDASWTRLGRDLSARGTIPSLGEPKGPPLVAFSLRVRGIRKQDGHMLARTPEHTLYYRLTPKGTLIEVGGVPLGSIQPDGKLLGLQGEAVEGSSRSGSEPIMVPVGSFSALQDKRERKYLLTLQGNQVAYLAKPRLKRINMLFMGKEEFPPAVELIGIPSDEEATWILALAILQVACYNLLDSAASAASRNWALSGGS